MFSKKKKKKKKKKTSKRGPMQEVSDGTAAPEGFLHMSAKVRVFGVDASCFLTALAQNLTGKMMLGDVYRFLSSFKGKRNGSTREISERKLDNWLKRFDDGPRLKQVLLDECFVGRVPKQPGSDKIKIVASVDRLSSYLSFPGMCEFARSTLVQSDFALLHSLLKAAYRADDMDFPDLVVRVMSEVELLRFVLIVSKDRGAESFRTDGLDTLLISRWAQRNCHVFLSFLPEALGSVFTLPDGFELDPGKVRHGALLAGNARNVETVCDAIIAGFVANASRLPAFVVHLVRSLGTTGLGTDAVSVLVLRILTPAIISPERFSLIDYALLPSQKRGLLMIAKALQQVANGVLFESTHFMFRLNGLIASHNRHLIDCVSGIAQSSHDAPLHQEHRDDGTALAKLLGRVPVYATQLMQASSLGPDGFVLNSASPNAVQFRFLYRFSLGREPKFLDQDENAGSSNSSSEDGSAKPVRSVAVHAVPVSMSAANNLFTPAQKAQVEALNSQLEKLRIYFTREFICTCLRAADFVSKRAFKILKSYSDYYTRELKAQSISIAEVESLVLEGVLLVHPQLMSTAGRRVMFMRPARYFPSKVPTSAVIKLLVYMTQRLTEDISAQVNGFTFVADLHSWGMQNFSQSYALTWFLSMLVMPVRLESFIIIDAPSWFGAIWAIIKTAMSRSFQKKWSYVTRDTIDSVMAKDRRPPDIADGTLVIDLAAWCEDRRVAEAGELRTMFRKPGDLLEPSARKRTAPLGPASASSSPSGSPRSRRMSSQSSASDEDSELFDAMSEIARTGIDNAEFDKPVLKDKGELESDAGTFAAVREALCSVQELLDADVLPKDKLMRIKEALLRVDRGVVDL